MQVGFSGGWFLCRDAFAIKDQLRNEGFMYLSKEKAWGTRQWYEVAKYRQHFDENAARIFDAHTIKSIEFKGAPVPAPLWNKLDPVQKTGVVFAMTRNHSYLAFDAGVGKTATAIMADRAFGFLETEKLPSLYIVPPNLVSNWVEEFKMWRRFVKPVVIRSTEDVHLFNEDAKVFICADSLFIKDKAFDFSLVTDAIKEKRFLTIAVDEAHRFINFEAARTKEMFGSEWSHASGIVHRAKKVILLSGTHMRRGPINLYPAVFALAWNLINYSSSISFGVRFCNGYRRKIRHREVWDFKGSSREDELYKRLYGKFILEKTLEEARPELKGKKIERLITLDGKRSKKTIDLEKAILKKYPIEKLIGSKNIGEISKYRELEAKELLEPAVDYMITQTDNFKVPSAIFVIHHSTIDMLMSRLKAFSPREISGRVKKADRVQVEKDFQSGECNLIIWQCQTAIGRNAQRGERCFFFESPWSPDEITQPIHRFYRRGQKKIVVADHLTLANSLGQYVLKTCLDKKETINNVRKGYQI